MITYLIGQVLHLIPSLLILVGCVFYLVRGGGPEGVLALVGKVGGVLLGLASMGCAALFSTKQISVETFAKLSWGFSVGSMICLLYTSPSPRD